MENEWHFIRLSLGLLFIKICCGYPIDLESADLHHTTLVWTPLLAAAALLLTTVVVLMGCVCCRQNKGFQEFTDSTSSHSLSGAGGYVNSGASTTEFTIFPPVQTSTAISSNRLSVPGDRSSIVRFEPLPDIRLPQPHGRRPAAFNNVVNHGLSSQDWFQDPQVNFPRQKLKYLRELGHGWFGRVIEGEAQNIVPEQKTSKVVVKILHEDATTTDQMYFLHEVKPYRELNHPNVLKLLGRCLETDPFLILLEACPSGDLKTFLSQNVATADALNQQGITLHMSCNIAAGLLHMHDSGFVHTDLAARNCLVTSDLLVKIGDYGTSIETFKEDYYCAGEVALPIRWSAPETLHCTDTTIETKEVTTCANVWSLAVVLWEVCEFGKLPYSDLNDDEVMVKVLGEGTERLNLPSLMCPQRQNLYQLMKLCWSSVSERPVLLQVHSMLNHLYASREQEGDNLSLKTDEDFECRWEMFKPNTIPKTDNHVASSENTPDVQSPARLLMEAPQLEVEDVAPQAKCLTLPSRDPGSSTTPVATSPQSSLTSSSGAEFFISTLQQRHKSPSLQNLRGSIDDLCEGPTEVVDVESDELDIAGGEKREDKKDQDTTTSEPDFDSWLKGVETTSEEDAKFVRKISEAIRDLDNALALEKTSSSSSSEASSESVSHQSPVRDATTLLSEQNVVLDFRLDSGVSSDDKEMMFQLDSLQDDSFIDNAKSTHLENRTTDSGTDTEDEMWRRRIERGEFSEKVKEKSKSVADLMVLTHIESSDGSDSDPPSLTWSFERSSSGRGGSFTSRMRPCSFGKSSVFSSESNIHGAVLGEEFRHTLKRLHDAGKVSCSPNSKHNRGDNFLAIDASEESTKGSDTMEVSVNSNVGTLTKEECDRLVVNAENLAIKEIENGVLSNSSCIQVPEEDIVTVLGVEVGEIMKNVPDKCVIELSQAEPSVGELTPSPFCTSTPCSEVRVTRSLHPSTIDLESNIAPHSLPFSPMITNLVKEDCQTNPLSVPDFISSVLLGPCEDYMLDYFKGLKTTSGDEPFLVDCCIDSWNKHLCNAFQEQEAKAVLFDDVGLMDKVQLASHGDNEMKDSATKPDHSSPFPSELVTLGEVQTQTMLKDVPCHSSEESLLDLGKVSECLNLETNEVTGDACSSTLDVPSFNFIAATPVPSGRNTPEISGKEEDCSEQEIVPSKPILDEFDFTVHESARGSNGLQFAEEINVSFTSRNMSLFSSEAENKTAGVIHVEPMEEWVPHDKGPKEAQSPDFTITPGLSLKNSKQMSEFLNCEREFLIDDAEVIVFQSSGPETNGGHCMFVEDFMLGERLVSELDTSENFETSDRIEDDVEDFGLDVAKHLTPDDERSSDSGFRDKGSLSESCDDACDEKYNLEDIEAELDGGYNYVENHEDIEDQQHKLSSDDSALNYVGTPEGSQKKLLARSEHESLDVTLPCGDQQDSQSSDLIEIEFVIGSAESMPVQKSQNCVEAGESLVDECSQLLETDSEAQYFESEQQDMSATASHIFLSSNTLPDENLTEGEAVGVGVDDVVCVDESCRSAAATTGWYLHPPPKCNSHDGPGAAMSHEEYTKYEEGHNSENSYVSFSLDEEFVTAIRNELRDKLSHAHQQSEEEDLEEDGTLDSDDDDVPQEERTDIMIHYNMYPAPLSPILEERESVSSVTTTISDNYSPFANQRDAAKSGSDSEPLSPVFVLDPRDEESEINAKKFEQEIREALENCSLSSDDTSSSCGRKESSVLFEDLEQQGANTLSLDVNVVVVRGTNQNPDDDDLLVVNTETNEATLLESPKPKSHLAFVKNRRTLQENVSLETTPDFFGDDMNSCTFVIGKVGYKENFDSKPNDGSSDGEVYTPDSISPQLAVDSPSASTLQSPDTENLSDFFLTPSEKSPSATVCPHGPQNSAVYNPYFLHSLSRNNNNPVFEEVQEICLGVANNEAAEIISELESSGIFSINNNNNDENSNNNNNNNNEKGLFTTSEKISIIELPSSTASSVNDNSEVLSMGDSSESSECTRKYFSDDEQSAASHLASSSVEVYLVKMDVSEEGNYHNKKMSLDLLKKRKECRQSDSDLQKEEEEEKDWSLPSLEASLLSTKAPMPSPEEESWKQIPSMLAFSEVMARCGNEQKTFGAVCVPYGGETEVDERDLMSTSFSMKGEPDDLDCYTPDWESGSDETNEEDNNSSSSGEFIWKEGDKESSVKAVDMSVSSNIVKPYEGLSDFPMEMIAEEEEEEEDDEDDVDGSSSSGSGTEFVPSAWNSEATPNRSALRSPDKKSDQKKNVSFKKQKYHSVYEYPRETSDSDSEGFDSPTRRHWNSISFQRQPQVDYSSFADWELLDGDVPPEGSGLDTDMEQESTVQQQQQLDFYKLSCLDYDFSTGMMSEDGEFYISSSARPFQLSGDMLTNNGSQFFPGQLYHMDSECKIHDVTVDFVTPDSGIIDITAPDKPLMLKAVDSYEDEIDTSISRIAISLDDQLACKKSDELLGRVWEVGSVEPQPSSIAPARPLLSSIVVESSNEKDSETVSQSPSSPLSPSGLGELRHTRDRLKLDLPASGTAFVLDPPMTIKRRSVETVKGEASLLDSGEETEDSGIESSNGTVTTEVKCAEDIRKT